MTAPPPPKTAEGKLIPVGPSLFFHPILPGLKRPLGSKLSFTRAARAARADDCGWRTGTDARIGGGCTDQRGVAAGRAEGGADQEMIGVGDGR